MGILIKLKCLSCFYFEFWENVIINRCCFDWRITWFSSYNDVAEIFMPRTKQNCMREILNTEDRVRSSLVNIRAEVM